MKLDEVEPWVKDQAAKQGPATIWRSPGTGRRLELLSYGVACSSWALHQPTRNGSPLDRLRVISQKLAKYYGWDEAQATLFLLTGMTPILHTIRSTVTTSSAKTGQSNEFVSLLCVNYFCRAC